MVDTHEGHPSGIPSDPPVYGVVPDEHGCITCPHCKVAWELGVDTIPDADEIECGDPVHAILIVAQEKE